MNIFDGQSVHINIY